MKSFIELEAAILSEDQSQIRDYLAEIDRKTESAMFRQASEHFGFRTVEHHGRRFAMRAEIGRVMGYIDESGLRKMASRYDLEAISVGTFGQGVRMSIVEELGLDKRDGKTVLVGWDTFLLAGMHGTNDAAKAVKLYLLNIERAGRVAAGVTDVARERSRRIDDAAKVVNMVSKASREKNAQVRARLMEYIDAATDGALNLPKQLEIGN